MIKVSAAILSAAVLVFSAAADDLQESDEIVRLPGQGEVKSANGGPAAKRPQKLVPGGGLLMSFDADGDAVVTSSELNAGVSAAYAAADANSDGSLTALEQKDWAAGLPTRDQTLSNPVRFDPNLDRSVSEAEFSSVIRQIASTYADANGELRISALIDKTPPERPERLAERAGRGGPGEDRPRRPQFW